MRFWCFENELPKYEKLTRKMENLQRLRQLANAAGNKKLLKPS
jgi:hypothetical protein